MYCPKFDKDRNATRGSLPVCRALAAVWIAISTSSSEVGISFTVVSAMKTVCFRVTTTETPNARWWLRVSMTVVMSL